MKTTFYFKGSQGPSNDMMLWYMCIMYMSYYCKIVYQTEKKVKKKKKKKKEKEKKKKKR